MSLRDHAGTVEEYGVIDPDVLWSRTTCGACVELCPVDTEYVHRIVDMRRYQVMIESAFPSEAGRMLKNLEKKGNTWGLAKKQRLEWTKEVDLEVPVEAWPDCSRRVRWSANCLWCTSRPLLPGPRSLARVSSPSEGGPRWGTRPRCSPGGCLGVLAGSAGPVRCRRVVEGLDWR
jgi:ferredoxin